MNIEFFLSDFNKNLNSWDRIWNKSSFLGYSNLKQKKKNYLMTLSHYSKIIFDLSNNYKFDVDLKDNLYNKMYSLWLDYVLGLS